MPAKLSSIPKRNTLFFTNSSIIELYYLLAYVHVVYSFIQLNILLIARLTNSHHYATQSAETWLATNVISLMLIPLSKLGITNSRTAVVVIHCVMWSFTRPSEVGANSNNILRQTFLSWRPQLPRERQLWPPPPHHLFFSRAL